MSNPAIKASERASLVKLYSAINKNNKCFRFEAESGAERHIL